MTLDHHATHIRGHGDAAMAALQQLDGGDVEVIKQKINVALLQLVEMRNALIAARRDGNACEHWLAATNAIISVLFGTEYPLAGLKQKRVTETREALETLLAQEGVN